MTGTPAKIESLSFVEPISGLNFSFQIHKVPREGREGRAPPARFRRYLNTLKKIDQDQLFQTVS
jgi:hypothetical protein